MVGTRRVHRLDVALILSREGGPPKHDREIHEALTSKLSGLVRVDEHTTYRVTSIIETVDNAHL